MCYLNAAFSGSPKTNTSLTSNSGRRALSKLTAGGTSVASPVYYQDHEMVSVVHIP
jgi:hypothetical protein